MVKSVVWGMRYICSVCTYMGPLGYGPLWELIDKRRIFDQVLRLGREGSNSQDNGQ